jgi:pimeloyl-ACP methyl ester carboxylesterase
VNHLIPPGAEEQIVALPEGRVRVLTGGTTGTAGIPLLLIHGGGTDNAGISWFRSFTSLGTDRQVVAIDLPGFGGTREIPPLGGPESMADFVVRVARDLQISTAVVIGVSMGGDVALNVGLRHPDFTAGLILVAPGGLAERVGGPTTHFFSWLGAQLPDALLLPLTRVANRFTKSVLKAIVADPSVLPPEVIDEFAREARAPEAGIAYGRYNQATLGRKGLLNNLIPRVREITVPTLLFHGLDDPLVNPDDSKRAAALMPAARLVLVPKTGHWAQLEAHDRFTEEVRRLLADIDRAQPGDYR